MRKPNILAGKTPEQFLIELEAPAGDEFIRSILASPGPVNNLLRSAELLEGKSDCQVSRLYAHAAFIQKKYIFAVSAMEYARSKGNLSCVDVLMLARSKSALGDFNDAKSVLDDFQASNGHNQEVDIEIALIHLALCDTSAALDKMLKLTRDSATGKKSTDSRLKSWLTRYLQTARCSDPVDDGQGKKSPNYWMKNWLTTYLQSALGSEPTGDELSQRALASRYVNSGAASDADVVFAVLDYKSPEFNKTSMNIGDYVQTVALMRHLARRLDADTTFDDPGLAEPFEILRQSWPEASRSAANKKVHLTILDRDVMWPASILHGQREIWTIFHGWYFHQSFKQGGPFPCPENINPIILSFYLQRPEDLTVSTLSYLKRNGPVGCRDWSTTYWLLNQGVDAFFSGCLTLTLDLPGNGERSGHLVVDAEDDGPGQNRQLVEHNIPRYRKLQFADAIQTAINLLQRYAEAAHVTTSRLHCYLPCRALGTPVTFVPGNFSDRRFDGLDDPDPSSALLIRERIMQLLDAVLDQIIEGKEASVVRETWVNITNPLVVEAQQRMMNKPHLLLSDPNSLIAHQPTPAPCMKNTMVALAFDEAVLTYAIVTIRSILANTSSTIEFVLLTRGINKPDIETIKTQFPQAVFRVIAMDTYLEAKYAQLAKNTTVSTMDRLYLPELLPDVDKIVYIDVDTIVLGDIAELARQETSSRGIAARPTPNPNNNIQVHWIERAIKLRSYNASKAREYRRKTSAALDLLSPYFNAGVLVLSLERLRTHDFTKETLQLVKDYGLEDQEALNLFSCGDYRQLGMEWNAQPYTDWFDHVKLIHWAGALKPWLKNRNIRHARHWRQYAQADSKEGSKEHWSKSDSYHAGWEERAKLAAKWLQNLERVADIGCGEPMSLKRHLTRKTQYIPADLKAWTPEVIVLDLDEQEFLPGRFDAVAMLGVLEYLQKPGAALRRARNSSEQLVTSYCHPVSNTTDKLRTQRGWINAFSERRLETLFLRQGWAIKERELFTENDSIRQFVYYCIACEPLQPPKLGPLATSVRADRLTYLRPEKMARLEAALDRVTKNDVVGDIVEFGVALGGSAIVAADQAVKAGRCFIGLDVFEMIPQPQSSLDDRDSRERYQVIANGLSKGIGGDLYYGYHENLFDDVVEAFQKNGINVDGENVILAKGLFEETWPHYAQRPIAFAHIDCDWFEPVSFCLEAMGKSLSPGGIVVIDDYYDYSGARQATNNFLLNHHDFVMEDGPNPILVRMESP